MPPGLSSTLSALGLRPDAQALARVVEVIGGSWSRLPLLRGDARYDVDVSEDTDSEALRALLAPWLADDGPSVFVAWPADRVAVEMRASALLATLDDLWYPSMDELIVVATAASGEFLVLVLDHEERLTCTRLAPRSPSRRRARVACVHCGQDWLRGYRAEESGEWFLLCPECDSLWLEGQDPGVGTELYLSEFLETRGTSWDRLRPEA
ncbi:hypothetical protein [Streptomyces sp. NPDC058955]|uniref:hypothetical protein n=1 Tax=unclassified Streptomyces TaxID=2593676 RepID=UPI0036550D36